MSDFRIKIEMTITARNKQVAAAKLLRALYSGRSHWHEAKIDPALIDSDRGMTLIDPDKLPDDLNDTDHDKWLAINKKAYFDMSRIKRKPKKERDEE